MPRLPVLSGRDLVRAVRKVGFEVHHQKGSHIILYGYFEQRVSLDEERERIFHFQVCIDRFERL